MPGRSFRWLWASSGLSNTADGVVLMGVPLIAVTLTRSPLLVSLVTAAVTLPWLLFSLHAGVFADRCDRRRMMVAAVWARAGVLAVLALTAWLGMLNLPVLLAGVLLLGAGEVFADSAAQAVVPMTMPRERLTDANGRLVATETVGNNFLGAPLAGILIGLGATLGITATLGAPALLYAAAGLALLGMRGRFRLQTPSSGPLRADIARGLRFLWGHRVLRSLTVFGGVFNFANDAYFAVFVLWVVGEESRVRLTPSGYGLLAVALALGAIAGSLAAGRLARRAGQAGTLVAVNLVNALLLLVPVLVPTVAAIGVTAVLLGATNAVSNVLLVSLRQRLVPERLMGRVHATVRLIGMGARPLGAAAGGVLAAVAGLPAVFCAAAGLCVLTILLVSRTVTARAVAAAEAEAESGSGAVSDAGVGGEGLGGPVEETRAQHGGLQGEALGGVVGGESGEPADALQPIGHRPGADA
ncbi:MFS transporter [Planobispora siamensis]|uniref:MFS transporter n=1 Tax=Planobispora siamensis TaxID=936338 RepID=A0A8J3SR15_9ACTN|nr:MFS transporter [Planobispora siamensis]